MRAFETRITAFAAVLASILLASPAFAAPGDEISRAQIIARANSGHGYGYWWGHGRWKTDGTKMEGFCTGNHPPNGCLHGDCYFTGVKDDGSPYACPLEAGTYNEERACYGADCAGYVAKAWDIGRHSEVELDEHPHPAWDFKDGTASCTRVTRRELLPGDAMATDAHVVLFDHFLPNGKDVSVHEAKGCSYRIGTSSAALLNFQGCRRDNVKQTETCSLGACSGHGRMQGRGCDCDTGYTGPECGECAPGYSGYPTCLSEYDTCAVVAEIKCGQKVSGDTSTGSSFLSWYQPLCGNWLEDGKELVYKFQPKMNGKANLVLSKIQENKDVDVYLMIGGCDAGRCQEYGDDSTGLFEVEANQTYYVAVDSFAGSEGSFELEAQCAGSAAQPWIGDKCDLGCTFAHPTKPSNAGKCYTGGGANFCTLQCTQTCPDLPDHATSFCVRDPTSTDALPRGMCVPRADSVFNHCCADVPGTELKQVSQFGGEATSWVCAPKG